MNRAVLTFFTNLNEKKKGADKELLEVENYEDLVKKLQPILAIWNKWRRFYFSMSDMKIKSRSQATILRRVKELIEDEGYNPDLFIACTMKAFTWTEIMRPGFSNCLVKGEEYYARYNEAVRADIEKEIYQQESSA